MVTNLNHSGAPARADAPPPQSPFAAATPSKFSIQAFTQPLDHFYNTTVATFQQRFWVNTRHYKPRPGAPVIVIDGGETSGEDRLPFLDTGIADILARATGSIGVVLEHRYYGESVGVRNFSTDTLRCAYAPPRPPYRLFTRACVDSVCLTRCCRWLNNEQALEDSANFIRNIKFEDIDEALTTHNTPWIYYGGSYAGARAAYVRVLYPNLVFGAIASSAVTRAVLTNWEYMDVIRLAADPKCSSNLMNTITIVDSLLKFSPLRGRLKNLLDLSELESDKDFVSVLTVCLGPSVASE
ncbi:serine carboxypeptidase S28-domain-containing protein [Lactifluus subvellereus]|nr:serine carboxypeptidase S28-domain-containing protein [Lactifluus subvellereus]